MSEKNYSPLSSACLKALTDKMYEKRKTAASEIEKMMKEFTSAKNAEQISKVIKVLEEHVLSPNPQIRKGGLMGLAAVSIGLSNAGIKPYITDLVNPILTCFSDSNPTVRFYACEALYNVVKVSRGEILFQFNNIYEVLVKLSVDSDQNVRNGWEMLDKVLKDIVGDSSSMFDLQSFVPLQREKLYVTNFVAQNLVISWVYVLQTVPELELLHILPEWLDGIFFILSTQRTEVQKLAEIVLGEFLVMCRKDPNSVAYSEMINIIIFHAQSKDQLVQYTSLNWANEFITLAGNKMFHHISGILSALLPCIAHKEPSFARNKKFAEEISKALRVLITENEDSLAPVLTDDTQVNLDALSLNLNPVMEVLFKQLTVDSISCKIGVLKWFYHLHCNIPNMMFPYLEELFHALLKTLAQPSDDVVLLAIRVMAQIASTTVPELAEKSLEVAKPVQLGGYPLAESKEVGAYFISFLKNMIAFFALEKTLLEDRGHFILRQLCVTLSADDIYRTLSELLKDESNLSFAALMIQTLCSILLTTRELFPMRKKLKNLAADESCKLFIDLYKSFSHCPVATLSLCLLSQCYDHAAALVHIFGELEVTVEFLVEIDKLIQLIESPIFNYLRIDLMDPIENSSLVSCMYGLLMLLPQSEAFQLLRCRLKCIPPAHLLRPSPSPSKKSLHIINIDFNELLSHFKSMQDKHSEYRANIAKERLQREIEEAAS